jgi:hypothetical protein
MKSFIRILLIFLPLVILTSFVHKQDQKENVEVVFNRTLKFDDLVSIKNELADKGITLEYKKLEFDENGGLITIYFKVDCNDGFKGSAGKSHLTNQSKIGFYRNYLESSKEPFGTGDLE